MDPTTPPLDPAIVYSLREAAGEELLRRLVTLVLELIPQRLATLREALRGGDLEAARREAHALRSTVGTVGATRLLAGCRQAEEAADLAEAAAALRALETLWSDLEPVLCRHLEPPPER